MVRDQFFGWQKKAHWRAVGAGTRDESRLAETLSSRFLGLRAFHACRPESVQAYYSRGIRGHDRGDIDRQARALFRSSYSLRRIRMAIDNVEPGRHGMAYLALDARSVLTDATHYLIYGSEHLNGIAAELDRCDFGPARRALLTVGTPTVFECWLPWSLVNNNLTPDYASELATSLAERWREDDWALCDGGTCFVDGGVPPEYIRGHRHARRAPDVFRENGVYDIISAPCDACSVATAGQSRGRAPYRGLTRASFEAPK